MSSHLHHPFASSVITWSSMFAKSLFLSSPFSPSRLFSLSAELKERRFYPPADLWYTPFLRLHASYITRLKQGCCNERYLEGTRSQRNSSIWYREDFANPQLKAKLQGFIKTLYISSWHTKHRGHFAFKSPCETRTTRPNLDILDYSWRLHWLQSLSSRDGVKQSQLHTS